MGVICLPVRGKLQRQLILEHRGETSCYVHVGPADASTVGPLYTLPRETAAVATMTATCCEKVNVAVNPSLVCHESLEAGILQYLTIK